ncbi:MAG: hypothetical protein K2N60_09400 [Oscillospiraceae bacterium]|nr:hypothetical protein [Oscillospiraceae bacterium]
MLKIVKGYGYGGYGYVPAYSVGEPVKIDNTVYLPGEDEETGEIISAEEQRRRAEEEKAREKAEEERRINEAVETKLSQILAERSEALEQERAQILEQGRNEAASISAKAKADTMAIMEKAKRECAMLKEQAKKEGFDEGFADGRKESLEKYNKYIDASGRLLSEINSRKEAYYISSEEEMRITVFELVNKIVRTELRTNPQVIEGIIAEAAKNFRNSDYIKITLAEDGITERFKTDEKLIKDIIPFIPEVEIEFDEDAEEGTVIEDNGSEIVDAGVPTQLEFLKEILRTTRGESDGSDIAEASFDIASDAVPAGSLRESAEAAEIAEAAKNAETAKAAEMTENAESAQEELPEQESFADVMADVMAGGAAKAAEEEPQLTEEEAAALMAELMAEAGVEASAEIGAEEAAVTETAAAESAEEAAPPKTAKSGRKTKPRSDAAENAE